MILGEVEGTAVGLLESAKQRKISLCWSPEQKAKKKPRLRWWELRSSDGKMK